MVYTVNVAVEKNEISLGFNKFKDNCMETLLNNKIKNPHDKKDNNGRARVLQYTIQFFRLLFLIGQKLLPLKNYQNFHRTDFAV